MEYNKIDIINEMARPLKELIEIYAKYRKNENNKYLAINYYENVGNDGTKASIEVRDNHKDALHFEIDPINNKATYKIETELGD